MLRETEAAPAADSAEAFWTADDAAALVHDR
jgi:hypothetical protein